MTRNLGSKARAVLTLAVLLAMGLGGLLLVGAEEPRGRTKFTGFARVSPLDRRDIEALGVLRPSVIPTGMALPVAQDSVYIPLHIEFKDVASRRRFRAPEGVTVYHEFDRFAAALLDGSTPKRLSDVEAMDGVVWIDVDLYSIRVPPPPKVVESKEKPKGVEKIVRGGYQGLTGKGVIVALVDNGIDFRHPDFIRNDKDGKPVSRLLYYWDILTPHRAGNPVGSPAPYSYPNGTSIGTLYTQEDLTAELRKPTGRISTSGPHGTPCAGVAVGNGNGRPDKKYAGVAPDADLIAVRVGVGGSLTHAFLLGAICAWLDEKAGEKPLVVSCSFGHSSKGNRDGCLVQERELDKRFAANRKGRAICIAAGNDAERGRNHAAVHFQGEEARGTLAWSGSLRGRTRITLAVDTADPDDVVVHVSGTPTPVVHRYVHPLSKALVVELGQGTGNPASGVPNEQAELWSLSRKKLRADAYLDGQSGLFRTSTFRGISQRRTGLVSTPGTMTNAITLGSYDFNAIDDRTGTPVIWRDYVGRPMRLGDLSAYSSPGYSRTGVVKPNVVAPGQYHITSQPGGGYMRFNGTSAATPYMAGLVALLLQRKPDLTVDQIKTLIQKHATSDEVTGRTPNPQWGYGRFDYQAVEAVFKAVQ